MLFRSPRGIFARSYVRTYAKEAGLDPDVVLARVIRKLPGDEAIETVQEAVAPRPNAGRLRMIPVASPLRTRAASAIFGVVVLVGLMCGSNYIGPVNGFDSHDSATAPPPLEARAVGTSGMMGLVDADRPMDRLRET